MAYDVLASRIYEKFTGEFKSNEYQKKFKSNKLRKFKSNGYWSLNQINSISLDQMISMEGFRCLRCLI